ncbi:hypothetical protein Avbf_13628, partial [Armadillidium vulgare]
VGFIISEVLQTKFGRYGSHILPQCTIYIRYGLPTRTNYRLIVENLSSRVSWQLFSFSSYI